MARFIMAGQLQAAAFVVFMAAISATILPPLAVLGNAAIALVTLRIGWQKGLILAFIAGATLALLYSSKLNVAAAFGIGLLQWLPVVFFAWLLFRTVSWDLTLQAVLVFLVLAVLLFHALVPDVTALWKEALTTLFLPLTQSKEASQLNLEQQVENIAPWMTGFTAASFALILIGSLLLARFWQAKLYNPGGFGEEFRQIKLGKNAALSMVVLTAVVLFSKNTLAAELLIVGMVVFLFQGLAVVHAIVKSGRMPSFLLGILYFLLVFLPVQVVVMMTTLAIIDNFTDLRGKLNLP